MKCCGYFDGKVVVDENIVIKCICVVVDVCCDLNFLIMVCIDIWVIEGLDVVIDCVKVLVDVGVDVIFFEVMCMLVEFEVMVEVFDVLILVNMIEFGKSELFFID